MKNTHLLTLTTAALLAAGSAFAGPNCKKCPKDGPQDSAQETTFEVIDRNDDGEAREGKKRERGEKGEKGERGEKGDHKKPERRDHSPLMGLDLTEEQQEKVKDIMSAAREKAHELMEETKAKKEAGEEIDRKEVHEKMMEIRKDAMKKVYDNVLNDEQRAKMDERRKKMEERRAEREKEGEGKDGERPERKPKGKKGEKKDRDADKEDGDGLEL